MNVFELAQEKKPLLQAGICSVILGTMLMTTSVAQNNPLDEFKKAAEIAKNASIRANMRTFQIAVESYAIDSNGVYPNSFSAADPYLPGGGNKLNSRPGQRPINPASGTALNTIYDAGIRTAGEIEKARSGAVAIKVTQPGQVGYSVVDKGAAYAIVGTDLSGKPMVERDGKLMVLSNY